MRGFLFSSPEKPIIDVNEPHFAQLRRLTDISRALTYTTSLRDVTELAVESSCELLDASSAVLMLSAIGEHLEVRAARGIEAAKLKSLGSLLPMDALSGGLESILGVDVGHFTAVPLIVGGSVTGVLAVGTVRVPTGADEWLLSALADHASVALENARIGGEVRLAMEKRLSDSEYAASSKDRALATLAHDIRTPLGAIDAYCAILEEGLFGSVNDRQRDTLGRVRMSGRHLLSLLDNVMEMARINAGALRLAHAPFRIVDVARDAIQMLAPLSDANAQVVELIELDPGAVCSDEGRVRQILVNLVGNAIKFTPREGSVTVRVNTASEFDPPHVVVEVTDTGPGIPLDEQSAIFEPYYRSEGTASVAGVGLGLAICAGLLVEMKGSLSIESLPGRGATFRLQLPTDRQCD